MEAIATRRDVHRFYFLDETSVRLNYCRHYGRAAGRQRVGQAVPLRRGRALTLIGVLGVRGLTAVQLLDGALHQHNLAFYVGRVLGPQLRRGDVLVLDNLAVHKLCGQPEALAVRGVQLLFYLPTRLTLPLSNRPGASSKPSCAKRRLAPGRRWKRPCKPPCSGLPVTTPPRGSTTAAITYTVRESAISTLMMNSTNS